MELAEAKARGADNDANDHASALLAIDGLTIRFGGVTALEDVSFEVARGAICGLIGPNGAGKTTLFNCVSRLYDPNAGSIVFDGRPLASFARHELASLGVARTFQNLALFSTMTVRENVCVGAHAIVRGGFLANALGTPLARREERRIAERADALIEEFGLNAVADRPGGRIVLRRPQAGGARSRARQRPKTPFARRAGRRAQPLGGRWARRGNPRHSRPARRRGAAGRASHESRHARRPTRSSRSTSAG